MGGGTGDAADMDLLPWNLSRVWVRTSDAGDRGWTATDGAIDMPTVWTVPIA